MFPGMRFLILSLDPDFVADMTALVQSRRGEVYVATSASEAQRLQAEITFEMLVVDKWFRVV